MWCVVVRHHAVYSSNSGEQLRADTPFPSGQVPLAVRGWISLNAAQQLAQVGPRLPLLLLLPPCVLLLLLGPATSSAAFLPLSCSDLVPLVPPQSSRFGGWLAFSSDDCSCVVCCMRACSWRGRALPTGSSLQRYSQCHQSSHPLPRIRSESIVKRDRLTLRGLCVHAALCVCCSPRRLRRCRWAWRPRRAQTTRTAASKVG